MFPLWDNIPSERTPFVNYAIVAACALVFLMQLQAPQDGKLMVSQFGMIPIRVTHPGEKEIILERPTRWGGVDREIVDISSPIPPLLTLLTSMFLHGGWMHIIGNLWFLLIFGDNIEDRFGHVGYALMYLICGLAAGFMHIASDANSFLPTIGASGAIAGVMGAYLLLYPRAEVMTLIPLGIFTRLTPIPAPIFLGFWFLYQVFSGVLIAKGGGGVAWWAHIGGFATGLAMTAGLRRIGGLNPPHTPNIRTMIVKPAIVTRAGSESMAFRVMSFDLTRSHRRRWRFGVQPNVFERLEASMAGRRLDAIAPAPLRWLRVK